MKSLFKREKFYLTTILLIVFTSSSSQNVNLNNRKIILSFFHEICTMKFNKDSVYNKYFYNNKINEPGRSIDKINFIKDSLFYRISRLNYSKINIYTYKEAKINLEKERLYDFYYANQDDKIFIISTTNCKSYNYIYVLFEKNKIISITPIVQDNKIIGWE